MSAVFSGNMGGNRDFGGKLNFLRIDRIRQTSEIASLYSLLLFLVAFPLSVSASQVFAGFTIFFFLFSKKENFLKLKTYLLPWSFVLGAYLLVFLSSLYHWNDYPNFWKTFTRHSEAGDFWMALVFPIAAFHSSQEKNQKRINLFLWISFSLILISGLISVFSEYRLGKFISNGFSPAPGDRRQHPAGPLFGFETYLPIGLMNTHLTYGGLLSFYLPGVFALFLSALKAKKTKRTLCLGGILLLSSWVFLLNQSKSAWLGVGSVLVFFVLIYIRKIRDIFPKLTFFRISVLLLGIIVLLVGLRFFYERNWLLQRTLSQLTEIQTPENQRYWIYKLSLPLLEKSAFTGIGGGRFKEISSEETKPLIAEQEQLWYELFITPNKHAHNDLLQFAIAGGWFAGILWLGFFYLLFRRMDAGELQNDNIPLFGIGFIWVAGFFQCYLLDDEVALPFFALAGILWGRGKETSSHSTKNAFLFLSLTFLVNIGFWSIRLQTPPELAYSRQVFAVSGNFAKRIEKRILPFRSASEERKKRSSEIFLSNPEDAGSEFSVEGCLTHRYPNPALLRTNPFTFGIYNSPEAKNPPNTMTVIVFSEESFDEDKLYWSHRKFDLGKKDLVLERGWNRFVWEETLPLAKTTIYPDIVFFRSFKIRFSGFDTSKPVEFPVLDFGDLCDYENKSE